MVLKLHEWPSFQTLKVLSRFMGGCLSWFSQGSLKVFCKCFLYSLFKKNKWESGEDTWTFVWVKPCGYCGYPQRTSAQPRFFLTCACGDGGFASASSTGCQIDAAASTHCCSCRIYGAASETTSLASGTCAYPSSCCRGASALASARHGPRFLPNG